MHDELGIAKKLFSDRGMVVERPTLKQLEARPDESYIFRDGSECHALTFGNGFIHFHIGREQWKEHLPSDAPDVRIRYMEFQGEPVAESEWFSC